MKGRLKLPIAAAHAAAAIAVGLFIPAVHAASAKTTAQRTVSYPSKPIRLIEGFPPGGASDYLDRLLGQKLTERFGQPVIVDNRPGASTNIGAEIAAKATADGYTLFMAVTSALAPGPALYPQMRYKLLEDFAYITLVASGAFVLLVHPSLPARSVPELVALARSKPGYIRYGSSGVGSPAHLAVELLKNRAGVNMLHVPYKGAAPRIAAMVGGEVQFGLTAPASALPLTKAGRLRALAVTSAQRAKIFPELPTVEESGFPGFDVTTRYGIMAPAGTPGAIVMLLNSELGKIVEMTEVRAMFESKGLDAARSTPERFRKLMQAEVDQWAKVVKEANIIAD